MLVLSSLGARRLFGRKLRVPAPECIHILLIDSVSLLESRLSELCTGLDVATCGVANATGFAPLAPYFLLLVASLATKIFSFRFFFYFLSLTEEYTLYFFIFTYVSASKVRELNQLSLICFKCTVAFPVTQGDPSRTSQRHLKPLISLSQSLVHAKSTHQL